MNRILLLLVLVLLMACSSLGYDNVHRRIEEMHRIRSESPVFRGVLPGLCDLVCVGLIGASL